MTYLLSRTLVTLSVSLSLAIAGDWTDYRGPKRDGTSPDRDLPTSWSLTGENLAWKMPYGGRSAPVVHGNRLYLLQPFGKGATMQERLLCLDADTGKMIWEYRMNVFLSDVPPHRIAWSSPAVDAETGNIYVYGVHGSITAVNKLGKLVWTRSLAEEVGLVTTHGGRTVSPILHENLVIVSGVSTGWGEQSRAAHRFMAFDKKTGEFAYISTPGGRPFDTTYSPPIIADIKGTKLLIAGGGDGTVHAIKVLTGEPVWKYVISKRGVNTGVLVFNNQAVVSHSEENLDTSEMGLLASVDATATGDITAKQVKWKLPGFQGGYSSPVLDGDRVFQIDNGANIFAFDFLSGRQLWKQNLGTIQKASPVLADGKIYVGTENGKFFILKPGNDKCDILSSVAMAEGEQILASAAVARGRIYFASTNNLYAIGKKGVGVAPPPYQAEPQLQLTDENPFTHMQILPAESILKPGEGIRIRARVYDVKGRFFKEVPAELTLDGPKGTFSRGLFIADTAETASSGYIRAKWSNLTGSARVRIVPNPPIAENFDSIEPGKVPPHWVNTTGKFQVREVEGKKVLVKLADNAFTKRARAFVGPANWSNFTVEADVLGTEKRRQMGDAGVVAQRYQLALFGNHQRLELQSWQPETERTVLKEFAWKKDTWYHLKLEVQNLPNGTVRARGKVWPTAEAEPAEWTIERTDPMAEKMGAAGLYADAPFEVFFDNFKVTPLRAAAGPKPAAVKPAAAKPAAKK
ncbi:MAG: PQQ-binding-like beta-propeller repeat protein [Bryobacterales bacterium]|nr:PQQ-binding-like beta-propeller repeat protein [Bryobacterales bacterium]